MKLQLVVQARTRSTRLPGKVLLPVCGKPLLERMLARVQLAEQADGLTVATTDDPSDDAIEALCDRLGVDCYRGHPEDCLDRHLQAGLLAAADAVVKIPSDCPLIDPAVIDRVLSAWRAARGGYDYLGNLHPASWPDGNDVEVIAIDALAAGAREATDPFDREHTTPFFWTQPERFRVGNVRWERPIDLSHSERWVVDWPEDYRFVCEIFAGLLGSDDRCFGVDDVLALLARRPELKRINAGRHGYSYWARRSSHVPLAAANGQDLEETRL